MSFDTASDNISRNTPMKTPWMAALITAALLMITGVGMADGVKDPITVKLKDVDVQKAVEVVAKAARLNVVVSPEVKGRISLSAEDLPAADVLKAIAIQVGVSLTQRDGVWHMGPKARDRVVEVEIVKELRKAQDEPGAHPPAPLRVADRDAPRRALQSPTIPADRM